MFHYFFIIFFTPISFFFTLFDSLFAYSVSLNAQ